MVEVEGLAGKHGVPAEVAGVPVGVGEELFAELLVLPPEGSAGGASCFGHGYPSCVGRCRCRVGVIGVVVWEVPGEEAVEGVGRFGDMSEVWVVAV